jgi:MFS family permease
MMAFIASSPDIPAVQQSPKNARAAVRRSLQASTADGVFAAIFSNATGGAILSSFFLELGANSTEIGLLSAIPMLANLLQPLGAYLSERTTSRHLYCLWIYGIARSLWLVLAVSIGWATWEQGAQDSQTANLHWLLLATLIISSSSHLLGALGSAAWLSWMAALVPRRLRGRYFGLRNSAANVINLLSVPLMGLLISHWFGGSIQGYAIVLGLGIVAGLVSISFQSFMIDVNPQVQHELIGKSGKQDSDSAKANSSAEDSAENSAASAPSASWSSLAAFLIYFTFWTFSVNLSAPFFNFYLLDSLHLNISQVTLYNSLSAAANLALLMLWGKLADRLGNRPILLSVGILVAMTPLFWLGTNAESWSIWLWFPLLHILSGATWAAIDLCSNNLQLGIAPTQGQTNYFGLVAAIAGISGAVGTIAGGFLAELELTGGVLGLFALSSLLRLAALLPLVFVHEQHGQSLSQIMKTLFPQAGGLLEQKPQNQTSL